MKQRILTAAALIPVVLVAIFLSSPWPILILAAIAGLICDREIKLLLGIPVAAPVSVALGLSPALFAILNPTSFILQAATLLSVLLFAVGVVLAYVGRASLSWGFVSPLWATAALSNIVLLHLGGASGAVWNLQNPALLSMLPLWAGDTAAIFAGRAFGKHPLAPAISPKKTIEGAVANLLACVAVEIPLAMVLGFHWIVGLSCGVAAGALGQAGDLFESFIKRRAGVKDSGTILPGHGGVMDRIDSVVFTAPAIAAIVIWYA